MTHCLPLVILYGDRSTVVQWNNGGDAPDLFTVSFRPAHGKTPHAVVVWGDGVLNAGVRMAIRRAIHARFTDTMSVMFQSVADFGRVPPVVRYLSEAEQYR